MRRGKSLRAIENALWGRIVLCGFVHHPFEVVAVANAVVVAGDYLEAVGLAGLLALLCLKFFGVLAVGATDGFFAVDGGSSEGSGWHVAVPSQWVVLALFYWF
jgi:hypothetical protein